MPWWAIPAIVGGAILGLLIAALAALALGSTAEIGGTAEQAVSSVRTLTAPHASASSGTFSVQVASEAGRDPEGTEGAFIIISFIDLLR